MNYAYQLKTCIGKVASLHIAISFLLFFFLSFGANAQINSFPHVENWESQATCGTGSGCTTTCPLTNGWTNVSTDNTDWRVDVGGTGSSGTGPGSTSSGGTDYNPGTSTGNYLYIESSSCVNSTADLISPTIDLTGVTNLSMDLWYHMLGATMGTMQVDVSTDGGTTWTNLQAPFTDNLDLWQSKTIVLNAYVGLQINIRIRGITGTSFTSDMAIDEISFYEVSNNDAGVVSIDSPSSPSVPGTNNVSVTIANYGLSNLTSATINWSVDGVIQTPYSWTGSVVQNSTDGPITIGSFNFAAGTHDIAAWTSSPNGGTDGENSNDSAFASGIIFCSPLSGLYTIDPVTGDYPNLTSAVNNVVQCGVSGPVTFNVSGGPFNERLILTEIAGASATNTITFNGNGQTIQYNSTVSADRSAILLDGADFVTINDFIIDVTGGTYGWGVFLTNQADNNTITNITVVAESNSTSTNYGGIAITGSLTSGTSSGDNGNNNLIQNNTVSGGYYGITLYGTSTSVTSTGNQIIGNTIVDNYLYGLRIQYQDAPVISGNDVTQRVASTSGYGIYTLGVDGATQILGNRLDGWGTYGIYLSSFNNTGLVRPVVANNMISSNPTTGTYGIWMPSAKEVDLFYNSVSIGGTGRALYISSTSTTNADIRNNSFAYFGGSTGYAIYITSTSSIQALDYNNYYSNGSNFVYYGSAKADLAALQATNDPAGNDANSRSGDPEYLSATNLHTNGIQLNDAGTPIPGITEDIDGDLRNTSTPDIGADEYTPPPLDVSPTALIQPALGGCFPPANDVIVEITNVGADPIDFSSNNLTVNTNITGPLNQSVSTVINSGVLNSGATMNVTVGSVDLSASGTYNFDISTSMPGDAIVGNNFLSVNVSSSGLAPEITSTTTDTTCGIGDVALSATSNFGTITWYDAPTGGNQLATGASYTATITATTDFYVQAESGFVSGSLDAMPLAGGNGCGGGNMFNVTSSSSMDLTGFNMNLGASAGTSVNVGIYFKTGTYVGSQTTSGDWTFHQTVTVTAAGPNNATFVPVSPLSLNAGTLYGIYLNADVDYTNITPPVFFSNSDITIELGDGLCSLFGGNNVGRGFNGTVFYNAGCASNRVAVTAVSTPAPPITITASASYICDSGSVTLTAGSPNDPNYVYTWQPGGQTGSSITVNITETTTFIVTGDDGTCAGTDTLEILFDESPVITLNSDFQTVCPGSTVTITADVAGLETILFSEITHYQGFGNGATNPLPSYLTGDDFIEISNIGSVPVDVSGWEVEIMGNGARTYTFASGVNIAAGGVVVLQIGSGTDDPANNFYFMGGSNNPQSSSSAAGYIIRNAAGNILDVVALNGFSSWGSSGVTTVDWSGDIASSSGRAGVIRVGDDTNTASDWLISDDPSPVQTLGSFNPGLNTVSSISLAWSTGATDVASITVNLSTTTTYSITATTAAGCSSTENITIVVSNTPTTPLATALTDTIGCFTADILIEMTESTGDIQWQSSSDGLSWTNIAGAISAVYSDTINQSTYYRVVTSCGNSSTSNVVYYEIYIPQVLSTQGDTRCGVGTVDLQATGSAGTTLNWYADATGGTAIGTGNTFTTPIIGTTTDFYASASIGGTTLNVGRMAPVSASNLTSSPRGLIFNANQSFDLVSVTVYSTAATAGSGTIEVRNSAGTTIAGPASVTWPGGGSTSNPLPQVINLGFNIPVGTDHRLFMTSISGGGISYEFSGITTSTWADYATPGNEVEITSSVTSLTGSPSYTTYYYFYNWEVSTGCESTRVPVTATVTPAPEVTITSSALVSCGGAPVTLTVSSSNDPNYNYTWQPGGQTGASIIVTPTENTTYIVHAIDLVTLCENYDTISIDVVIPPSVSISATGTFFCDVANATLSAGAGGAPTVIIGTGTLSSATSAGPMYISSATSSFKYSKQIAIYTAAEILAAGGTAGLINQISWFKTNTNGYTNGDAFMEIYVKPVSFDQHASSPITWASEISGATLVYSSTTQNLNTSTGWQDFSLTNPFNWNGSDNLEIFVDFFRPGNATGAVNWEYTSTTNANAITGASSLGTTASRNSNRPNVMFGFSQSLSYSWSPATGLSSTAGPSVTATPTTTTTYTVVVTDNLTGCTGTDSVTIVVGVTPTPVISSTQSMPLCEGASTTLSTQYTAANGNIFNWNSGLFTSESITVNLPGTYTVVVTSSDGCTSTLVTFEVKVTTIFADILEVIDASCYQGSDGSVELDVLGALLEPDFTVYFGPFDYSMNGGALQSSPLFTGLSAGTYTFTVHDPTTGCILNIPATVGEAPQLIPGPVVINQNVSCNGLSNGSATASASGGTGPYTFSWNTPIPKQGELNDEIPVGTWVVTVTDANGCTATTTVTMTEPDPLAVVFNVTDATFWNAFNGGIEAIVTGGVGNYSYVWSTGATTAVIGGLHAGTYTLTITDGNNCVLVATAVVNEPAFDCVNGTQTHFIQGPGGWGGPPSGNNPATYLYANFAAAFPNGLSIGHPAGTPGGCNRSITLTTEQAITDFLPSAGQPRRLDPGHQVNITASQYGNIFASMTVALTLSVVFDTMDVNFSPSTVAFGEMVYIGGGPYNGMTVYQILNAANTMLACGGNKSQISQLNTVIDNILHQSNVLGCPSGPVVRIVTPEINTVVEDEVKINIYPNPTSGVVNISFESVETNPTSIMVMDMQGRIVMQLNNDMGTNFLREINLSQFENGLYIINFINEGGIIKSARISKVD